MAPVRIAAASIGVFALTSVALFALGEWTALAPPVLPTPQLPSCAVTASVRLLPEYVADAAGSDPAWVVPGGVVDRRGMKTLWIFKTRKAVRVVGREITSGAAVRFQRGHGNPITDEMSVENTRADSVVPSGAPRALLDTYAFIMSSVHYPDPGCYRFDIDIAGATHHITVQAR